MLGKRIKELREQKGLLQKEIANLLGISQQAVARWENGQTEPNSEALAKLAEIFNCSVDYLLGRTNIRTPIETIATHRSDDPINDLPEEAIKSLEEFKEFILRKYGKE